MLKLEENEHSTWTVSFRVPLAVRRLLTMVPLVELSSGRQVKPLAMLSGKVLTE